MPDNDHARYIGPLACYHQQVAEIRPHADTDYLPLDERKVLVRWLDPALTNHQSQTGGPVGREWHLMPACHFKILVRV